MVRHQTQTVCFVLGSTGFFIQHRSGTGDTQSTRSPSKSKANLDCLCLQIIGKDTTFLSPFGRRRIVYCDYVASGRSLKFLEDYLLANVLPHYGNTHTTTSVTSTQTTLFRHEARDIVRFDLHTN